MIRMVAKFHCDEHLCLQTIETNDDDIDKALRSILTGRDAWTITAEGYLLCDDPQELHDKPIRFADQERTDVHPKEQ